MRPMDKPWFVAVTKPCSEEKAAAELEAAGLSTYVPKELQFRRRSRHAKRKEATLHPFLQRYVCVAADSETVLWSKIPDCKHVIRPLGRTRSGEISAMRAHEDGTSVRTSVATRALRIGQTAEVSGGPLFGQSGIIKSIRGQVAMVELSLLGTVRDVAVPLQMLEAA
jgi:transcription antitermination factor NusG